MCFTLSVIYTNWNLAYTTRQGSRDSCLAQTGFAAFDKGVQLISGSPYAETEQLSRLSGMRDNLKVTANCLNMIVSF